MLIRRYFEYWIDVVDMCDDPLYTFGAFMVMIIVTTILFLLIVGLAFMLFYVPLAAFEII